MSETGQNLPEMYTDKSFHARHFGLMREITKQMVTRRAKEVADDLSDTPAETLLSDVKGTGSIDLRAIKLFQGGNFHDLNLNFPGMTIQIEGRLRALTRIANNRSFLGSNQIREFIQNDFPHRIK